jgi:hypothetical protein
MGHITANDMLVLRRVGSIIQLFPIRLYILYMFFLFLFLVSTPSNCPSTAMTMKATKEIWWNMFFRN